MPTISELREKKRGKKVSISELRERSKERSSERKTKEEPPEPVSPLQEYAEKSLATAPGRMVAGMGKAAIVGPFQAGAFLGDYLRKKLGIPGKDLQPQVSSLLQDLKAAQTRGGFAEDEFDLAGLLGEMVTYAGAAPKAAGTFLARRGQDAASGAALGAASPSENEAPGDYLRGQLMSSLFGGAVAPAVGGVADAAMNPKATMEALKSFFGKFSPEMRSGRILNEMADNPQKVIQALKSAATGETAGQAAARAGDTGLPGIEVAHMKSDPGYNARLRAQDAARETALRKAGAGKERISVAESARDTLTGPMRKQALERADIAADVPRLEVDIKRQNKIIEDALDDQQFMSDAMQLARREMPEVAGMQEAAASAIDVSEQAIAKKMAQIQNLTKLGNKPLVVDQIVSGIGSALKDPKNAGLNTQRALQTLSGHLRSLADENGVIPAEALYQVRKTADDLVESQLKGTKSDRGGTAASTRQVKNILDDAIETAANGGWKDYLETYAQMSHVIDRFKFMEAVRQKMVPAANDVGAQLPHKLKATSDLIGRGQEKLAKKVNKGVPIEPNKLLSEKQQKTLADLHVSIGRRLQYESLAKTGEGRATSVLGDPKVHSPRLLWRPATIAVGILERISGRIGEQTRAQLKKQLMDPQVAAAVMEKASAAQQKALFDSGLISDMAAAYGPAAVSD